jgi:hypothetical protein
MKSFLVFPLAWSAAFLAVHSSLHSLAVFCWPVPAPGGVTAATDAAVPRHSAMKSFLVFPLAWSAAFLAVHSSLHSLAVFCWSVPAPGVVAVAADVAVPQHSAMKSFLVFPLAWSAAFLAVHSSLHSLAVFCWAYPAMAKAAKAVRSVAQRTFRFM